MKRKKKYYDKQVPIQKKLTLTMLYIMIATSVILIGSLIAFMYVSNMKTLKNSTSATLTAASSAVERSLNVMAINAQAVASSETIQNLTATKEQRLAVMKKICEENKYDEVGFVTLDGKGYSNYGDFDFNDQLHFQNAKEGKLFVGEPIVNRLNGKAIIIAGAPVYNNGQIIGTVYVVDNVDTVNSKIAEISFGKTGYAYVINKEGKTLFHKDEKKIVEGLNPIELAKKDNNYKSVGKATSEIISNKSGTIEYRFNGKKMYAVYSPVKGYDEWSIVMTAPKIDFTSTIYISILVSAILACILLVISIYFIVRFIKQIIGPINKVTERLQSLSEGDLTSNVEVVHTNDEIEVLSNSLEKTVENLNSYLSQISNILNEISNGNLNFDSSTDFKGDFSALKTSIDKIVDSLNETLSQINQASEQVADGSEQVAGGAQALSEGAMEQAGAVEELAATIGEISEHIKKTADYSLDASEKAKDISESLKNSKDEMNNMEDAMKLIAIKSNEINNIIGTIEDIAEQTNLLALNAAIEAARAGDAGKGFAVVANEIRNLAGKSAEAVKDTTELINESITAVKNGNNIVDKTVDSILNVVENVESITGLVDEISEASNSQAQSIEQVTDGVNQISSVVQNNSAVAEESAAASEELSSQAQLLKEAISQFKLRD